MPTQAGTWGDIGDREKADLAAADSLPGTLQNQTRDERAARALIVSFIASSELRA